MDFLTENTLLCISVGLVTLNCYNLINYYTNISKKEIQLLETISKLNEETNKNLENELKILETISNLNKNLVITDSIKVLDKTDSIKVLDKTDLFNLTDSIKVLTESINKNTQKRDENFLVVQ